MSEAVAPALPSKRDLRGPATLLLVLAILLALPAVLNDYTQYIANAILVYSLAGLGFNIVLGYLGQLAFINAAFFGLGAYATTLGMKLLGLPFWLMLVPAAAVGAAAGALTTLPALRLKRYYLAIVTMTLSELMRWVYVHSDVTGGASGLAVPEGSLPFLPLDSGTRIYFAYLAITIAVYASTRALLRQKPHRIFAAGIVQVSQGCDLFPEMSVLENLRLGAICRQGSETERLETVFSSFPRLAERRTQRVVTLSGGEQQMVAIGRAMMGTPRLLMLDEPSGGLAPRFVDEIAAIMTRLREQRATMLIVEQNIELALRIADRIYILRNGGIMGCETVVELGTDYRALARRFYL